MFGPQDRLGMLLRVAFVMARKGTPEKIDADVGDALERALSDNLHDRDIDLNLSLDDLETQISKAASELQAEKRQVATGVTAAPNSAPAKQSQVVPVKKDRPANDPAQELAKPATARPAASPSLSLRPANDEGVKEHARSLRNLNRRLPRTIYWLTAIVSIAWLGGMGAFLYAYYGPSIAEFANLRRFLSTPSGAVSLITLFLPVILFWAFAIMVRRAQEMRIAAQTMAEAAFRLVEPESLGQERVMTVGQAVRREVAAMSEGIERTLARAAELETLVHSEVSEIERAYTDNEVRIRSLVEELGHERDSVISHADRVRASIASAHEQLRDELSQASDLIRENVLNSSTQLTLAINQSGDSLVDRISDSGSKIHSTIEARSDEIASRMVTSGEAFATLIDMRIAKMDDQADFVTRALAGSFESREQAITALFNTASQKFSNSIGERSDQIVGQLSSITANLGEVLHGGAHEMLGLVNTSTQNLTSEINSRISTLETAVSARGNALITEFETRAHALDQGTERLNAALDARARMINETLLERSKDISRTFADGQEKSLALLAETRTGIQGSLVEQTEELRRVLDDRITEIRRTINDGHQSTADLLKDTQSGLKVGLGAFTTEVGSLLDARRAAFEGSLTVARDAIQADLVRTEELLSNVGTGISNNLNNFTSSFDSVYETRRSLFETSLQGVRTGLQADLARAEELLKDAGTDIRDTIGGFSDDLGSVFEAKRAALERSLDGAQTRLIADLSRTESLFTDAGATMQSNVENFASKVDSILDTRAGAFEKSFAAAASGLSADLSRTESLFTDASAAIQSNVGNFAAKVDLILDTRTDAFERSFAAAASGIEVDLSRTEELLLRSTSGIQGEFANFTDNLDSILDEKRTGFDSTLAEAKSSIEANLARTEEILARAQSGLLENFDGFTDNLDKMLEGRRASLFGTLDDARVTFASAISDDLDRISMTRLDIETVLRSELEKIDSAFASQTGAIEERTSTMRRALEMGVEAVRKVLESSAGTVAATLRDKVREAADDLSGEAIRASENLELRSGEFIERVDERIAETEARLASRTETLTSGVIGALDEADQRIMARVHQVSAELDARAGEVERRLASSVSVSADSLSALNERISEQAEQTAQAFEDRTTSLASMLDDRTREISRILDETAQPLADRMAESGLTAAAQLEEATRAATERLRRENAALVQSLASRTSETLAAMDTARTELETGITDLIDRLSASNMNLGQLIDLAANSLGSVDQRISETSNTLAATSATLSENAEKATSAISTSNRILETNVHRLADVSSNTLKEVASIASRFDEHGRVLASASDLLNAAQASLSTTLEDRQSALQTLAIGLVRKSEEIENTLRSFESLVTSAFDRAETKSIDSSEKIRTTVTDIIEQATGRFADATEEMRGTAASIRAELEATRTELKRGVMELPEETRESTAKMRRAVSEQINALKELSDIVAKSGRMYDASPSQAEQRIAPAPAESALRLRPAPPLPTEAPALRGSIDASVTPAARPATAAQPQAAAAAKQAGWVSDLLRRASSEEDAPAVSEPRPALHVVESLNSLSVDIARAIDHNASVELWERYRRGERNVFTRRLYTIKGQQTFDEIRRKYQTDSDFRGAVDRYVTDFEKLLQDVAANDRDSIMTQTYLTSDTGKVYTMLAHASGRIR